MVFAAIPGCRFEGERHSGVIDILALRMHSSIRERPGWLLATISQRQEHQRRAAGHNSTALVVLHGIA